MRPEYFIRVMLAAITSYSPCNPVGGYYYDPHLTDRRIEAWTCNFPRATQPVKWQWQSWDLNLGQSDSMHAFNNYLLSAHCVPHAVPLL